MAYSRRQRARRALRYFNQGTAAHAFVSAVANSQCDELLIKLTDPKVREAVDDALQAAARELSGERRVRVLERAESAVLIKRADTTVLIDTVEDQP